MKNKFTELTAFIPKFENDTFGEWVIDNENDGTPEHPIQFPFVNYSDTVNDFRRALYQFFEAHPEYELQDYAEILNSLGIGWDADSMEKADVSCIDSKGIFALIIGAIRAERFCDGALLAFFNNGCITKWLKRLEEIDEK